MKKSFLIVVVLIGFVFLTSSMPSEITPTVYCDGWEEGYCQGWKDVKGKFSICPVTPVCPVPEVGKDGYNGGYNRGFKAGKKKAEE